MIPVERIRIGAILAEGLHLFGRRGWFYTLVGLIWAGLPLWITTYIYQSADGRMLGPSIGSTLPIEAWLERAGLFLAWGLVSFFFTGSFLIFVTDVSAHDASGQPAGLRAGFLAAFIRLPGAFGQHLLQILGVAAGWLILVVPGVIWAVMWSVSLQAYVVERTGPIAAFGRSRALTKGSRWRVLGFLCVYQVGMAILGLLAAVAPAARPGLAVVVPGLDPGPYGPIAIFCGLLSALLNGMTIAIAGTWSTALYLELREHKEGAGSRNLLDMFA